MTAQEVNEYLSQLTSKMQLGRYVPRRFAAAEANGNLPADFEYRFRGMLRDREPQLSELLNHPRLLILAEPGGGKSVVCRAAVLELAQRGRVPVLAELKEYRGDLQNLLRQSAAPSLLDPAASIGGTAILRGYVLDGIDEIPEEFLDRFVKEFNALVGADLAAQFSITARQAFYVSNRARLPDLPAIFHILDFSDEDIRNYVTQSGLAADGFMEAVHRADAIEELRNPFILSVIVERFRQSGGLSDLRTENISYMIECLIQSRPRVNQHRQRRALRFLGVAMETYSRNELTEDEALRVIKESMRISDGEARTVLGELYASILKRTSNGLAFQSRSFGEYLAAEALEDEQLHRVQELTFIDHRTPNESWLNAISYLAELNADVRRLFVRQYPFWMIHVSPAAFSREEKDTVVSKILATLTAEGQYVTGHPQIQRARLERLVTDAMEAKLINDLPSANDIVRGNALVLLGLRKQRQVLPVALAVIKDRALGVRLRHCALIAITNVGGPEHVEALLPLLDGRDHLDVNLNDAIGAIVNEAQLREILPRILRSKTFLTSTYYHFREFTSRSALVEVLRYVIANPDDLNAIRSEGYIEPILRLMERYWDEEIANLCVDLLETAEARLIYPDPSGSMPKFFELVRKVDHEGLVVRLYFERALLRNDAIARHIYFVDQIVASLMTPATARWLVEKKATTLIKQMAGYVHGEIREIFRPHSEGLIDAQDANAAVYREENAQRQKARKLDIEALQERLVSRTVLHDALSDFAELSEAHWPELPATYKGWLTTAVSKQMVELDLEHRVEWKGDTLWEPSALPLLLRLVDRYEMKLEPDQPLVFAITGWATEEAVKYFRRFGFSSGAVALLEGLLADPPSSGASQGLVSFIRETDFYTEAIDTALKTFVRRPFNKSHVQVDALNILSRHRVDDEFLVELEANGTHAEIRQRTFETLVERQHRPTIERHLSRLLLNQAELKSGEVGFPPESPLAWIAKVRSRFAWEKLAELREKALRLELPSVVGIVTETLANIDRKQAAALMRRQISIAPESWRPAQQARTIEQEHRARIEEAQRTPFDEVLRKLKRGTSINRLKLLCEGSTDEPVFKALLAQVPDTQEVIVHDVGGWPGLRTKDPNILLLGCKEAVLVMDGDQGRHLKKRKKPFTKLAKEEQKRLSGFPIEFFVLERYGIENYFPRTAIEKLLKIDLSPYFPIPDYVSVTEYLSEEYRTFGFQLKRLIASIRGRKGPSPSRPLYSKSRNGEIAKLISIDVDLGGTDLAAVIMQTARRARELAE